MLSVTDTSGMDELPVDLPTMPDIREMEYHSIAMMSVQGFGVLMQLMTLECVPFTVRIAPDGSTRWSDGRLGPTMHRIVIDEEYLPRWVEIVDDFNTRVSRDRFLENFQELNAVRDEENGQVWWPVFVLDVVRRQMLLEAGRDPSDSE